MKILLPLAILLLPGWAFALDDCECRPIEYERLLNMSAPEVAARMEVHARYKQAYSTGGASYCYYLCATEYEHLRAVKQDKEIERSQERISRQPAPPRRSRAAPGSVPGPGELR